MITKGHGKFSSTKNERAKCMRRGAALELIVPKLLGVLWDRGRVETITRPSQSTFQHGFIMANTDVIEVGGRPLGHGIYQLAIWWKYAIVLSLYVAVDFDVCGAPAYRRSSYIICCCKRGEWEDEIIAENGKPRTLEQLRANGLVPKRRWVDWWNRRRPHVRGHARNDQTGIPFHRT